MEIKEIVSHFTTYVSAVPYGNGHINDTFLSNRLIIQRINTAVFKDPDILMENIVNITDFLRDKIVALGGNPQRDTLNVIKTIDGENLYKAPDGNCYRAYTFVENSVSYDAVNCELLYKAAKAFGRFQNMLVDYPAETLHETIPYFHDTVKRFQALVEAIDNDVAGRKESVLKEIDFAMQREKDTHIVVDSIREGSVPLRVTHNDTKLNNVLFDKDTDEILCVIDLDTVMPGSLLYDFGDALRFGGASGAEDEKDLDKIYFELDKFEAFTKGFVEEVGNKLTKKEIELLPFSVKLLTYECGIRFLTDYLNGDTYFKTAYADHNLDRAHTQFKLVYDIEQKLEEMKKIVAKYI